MPGRRCRPRNAGARSRHGARFVSATGIAGLALGGGFGGPGTRAVRNVARERAARTHTGCPPAYWKSEYLSRVGRGLQRLADVKAKWDRRTCSAPTGTSNRLGNSRCSRLSEGSIDGQRAEAHSSRCLSGAWLLAVCGTELRTSLGGGHERSRPSAPRIAVARPVERCTIARCLHGQARRCELSGLVRSLTPRRCSRAASSRGVRLTDCQSPQGE